MKKVSNQNTLLEIKDGVFKSAKEIEHMTNEVVDFHADCLLALLKDKETDEYKDKEEDKKHYSLAMHHIAAIVDLQLTAIGFDLVSFNSKDLDKLPPRLREITIKSQEWRKLPTLEPVPEMTHKLIWKYCRLMQETYNEDVLPLLRAKANELEGV